MKIIPSLPHLYDEPFGDSSAIPTFLVSKLAREQVTVSLSGDGGDELFAGYSRYQRTDNGWRNVHRVPYFVRTALSRGLSVFARRCRAHSLAWRAQRLARYLPSNDVSSFYDVQMSQCLDEHDLVLDSGEQRTRSNQALAGSRIYDSMMYTDTMEYLPGDILAKVDRASMGVSLESRIPLLDHHVVELAWRLPFHMKIRDGSRKWVLKQVLRKYVPDGLVNRPKKGFAIPVGDWVRGPLRDWAEDLLSEKRLKDEGYLNAGLVREQWSRHMKAMPGGDDATWQLLMFQEWLRSTSVESSGGVH